MGGIRSICLPWSCSRPLVAGSLLFAAISLLLPGTHACAKDAPLGSITNESHKSGFGCSARDGCSHRAVLVFPLGAFVCAQWAIVVGQSYQSGVSSGGSG